MQPETGRVEVNGAKVLVRCWPGQTPTVVVIPALGQTVDDWVPVLESLETEPAVWSVDRPAIGQSPPRPDRAPMSYTAFAAELDALLVDVPGPYVLVGHSLGGLIALAHAQQHPDHLAGVVLVDPSLPHLDLGGPPTTAWIDGDDTTGNPIDADTDADLVAASAVRGVPAVVLSRTPGWHSETVTAAEDRRWHRWHTGLADRWAAPRLVAASGGHQLQREAPRLVAYAIDQVVDAVRAEQPAVRVDPAALAGAGGG